MNDFVKIVEVGARDGLQNESVVLSLDDKLTLINNLVDAGLKDIEVGSCVSPKWVPQMAGSTELFAQLTKPTDVNFSLLTPNLKGYQAAVAVGCREVAIFTGASESFTQKNINCTIAESLARFDDIMAHAKADGVKVRGYVSCMVDCPYEGAISPVAVADVVARLIDMGCYEVSLGETIGTATPDKVEAVWHECQKRTDTHLLAGHFHNTYGMAIANVYASLNMGIRTFDSSIAGLGGCPYAKGASGNVATEDLHYLLDKMGYQTGVDKDKLMHAGKAIMERLGRTSRSNAAIAYWQSK
ncbi:hydroxymethylglutaryl-CoA lyase [Moraxella caviae]|uniref:Hydroxymethylglutaryl-CoA lyase n=1 Tax=Moraxella caviae TaxID=34060 RepID=A0A1T0A838_9GAMM|nr:hydroxymethylglutaryl-CoA lyase [Moraxella caviae]OOR91893.1 hydroxymethylglutaryl-CoA lyase [Moraxella caviae]STZ09746.1 Hydroxymethylglutaryl-CoA lyase yngG [Moraxella caviae]VEW11215.1 Hydroxymethylglutaryl-CoA lyase yngG [Moraxella caviae]